MSLKKQVAYGSWKSPITPDFIVTGKKDFLQIAIDQGDIYWVERRPEENGRYVIVKYSSKGKKEDVIPRGFSARTLVYEYGGGSFAVSDGKVYFSNFSGADKPNTNDQRVFRKESENQPIPITPEVNMRYGDGVIDKRRNRMICIREDHTVLQKGYAVTEIVALDLDGQKEPVVLLSYPDDSESDYLRDFYSSPCLSPDGEKLAWLAWNFGRMPWDSNELWVAEFDKNGLLDREKIKKIAGNTNELEKGESLFQPQWWQNKLYYVSDRDKWWHIYRHNDDGDEKISKNAPKDVEFAAPQWNLRMSTYSFLTEDTIIAAYNKSGIWKLGEINTETFVFKELPITFPVETEDPKFKEVTEIKQVRVCSGKVVFIAGGPYFPSSIVRLSEERTQMAVIQRGTRIDLFNKSPESKEPLYNRLVAN